MKPNKKNPENDIRNIDVLMKFLSEDVISLFYDTLDYIESLGDDIEKRPAKRYISYRTYRIFVSVIPDRRGLFVNMLLDPKLFVTDGDYLRDKSESKSYGPGRLQAFVRNRDEFEKTKQYIKRAYNENSYVV